VSKRTGLLPSEGEAGKGGKEGGREGGGRKALVVSQGWGGTIAGMAAEEWWK
jgi:hypothetical protein